MKLSKKGEYALRALIDISLAQECGRPRVRLSELSEKENIPTKFLEQILIELKHMGYLQSVRGKTGGYRLARPATEISIGEVVRRVDGPLAPLRCVSQTAYERCSCPDEEHCGLRLMMLEVRNAIASVLDRYTLAEVSRSTLQLLKRDGLATTFAHQPTRLAEGAPTRVAPVRLERARVVG